MELEFYTDRLLECLIELSTNADRKTVIEIISESFPPERVDEMFKVNEIQDVHKLLYALVNFFRDKKKEAKARGVKSFYGN